jgi:predicted alpha/beta hydrolase
MRVSRFVESHQEWIATADGSRVAAQLFVPAGAPAGAVLVVPAMGSPQTYYAAFAAWLSEQGFLVATFDYRGTGRSRAGRLRDLDADIIDWARLDCGAMLDTLAARAPGAPLYWIGHSLGGQILPFVPQAERLAGAVTVAAGSGYWRENAWPLRRRAWWLWYVVAPVATRIFGYFPGRRLRKVGDLPRGVMDQWRRWCLHPEYAVGVEGEAVRAQFAAVTTPILSLSFTDDEFMSERNTASLHGFYVNAPRVMTRIAPSDINAPRIGHFGFFKSRFGPSLWRRHLLPALVPASD